MRDRGMRYRGMRYREACLGCPLLVVEDAATDLRASPLVDSHAHDGRFGPPDHDLVFNAKRASRLRCDVDGKRARQGARCRFAADDPRLVEAPARAARPRGPKRDADDEA